MKTTNIYVLIDPITDKVRYVGKTNKPPRRYKAHLNRARNHQTHKKNWIDYLRKKNKKPIIKVIDKVPVDEWIFWEKYWISQFRAWGFNLVNHMGGGQGTLFGNKTSFKPGHTPWSKGTANTKFCRECEEEFKVPPSLEDSRKHCSQECYAKYQRRNKNKGNFSKGHEPWNKGKSGYKTSSRKKVYQYYGSTGEFIKEWESAIEASNNLNINRESIGNCCRNESKTAGGFQWSYKRKDKLSPVKYNSKTNTKIKNELK